ncbi:MAG: hypothetical protein KJ556_08855 [Gammaproteobacteria bacterium]|nr:hypothetical protein [Gammaproteobacteria bacterium]MBU2059399.1 hypothetical protein [Gammaproteobacteria bacterium]MBU2175221.1 hypothetical protein [Gammaproteobacteria bacterium]MBU2247429.1 hypothetical protein [Gammaproteobacteria bacterium]MBU2346304.1 hypothetical protein [Gammaproteobacteria bacterium]
MKASITIVASFLALATATASAAELLQVSSDNVAQGGSVVVNWREWSPSRYLHPYAKLFLTDKNGNKKLIADRLPTSSNKSPLYAASYTVTPMNNIGKNTITVQICDKNSASCDDGHSIDVFVSPKCELKKNSSGSWYQCGDAVITQKYGTMFSNSTITEFKVRGNYATWRFFDQSSGGGTTGWSTHQYFANTLDGGAMVPLTQKARSSFSDDQRVMEFQVKSNKAVWKYYDGRSNCGLACTSDVAYYYQCLNGTGMEKITPVANSRYLSQSTIEKFSLNTDATFASWDFVRSGSRSSENTFLPACN